MAENQTEMQLQKLRERMMEAKDAAVKESIKRTIEQLEANASNLALLLDEAESLMKDTDPEGSQGATGKEKVEKKRSQDKKVPKDRPESSESSGSSENGDKRSSDETSEDEDTELGLVAVKAASSDEKILAKVAYEQLKKAMTAIAGAAERKDIPIEKKKVTRIIEFWDTVQRLSSGLTEKTICTALTAMDSELLANAGLPKSITHLETVRRELNEIILSQTSDIRSSFYTLKRKPSESINAFVKRAQPVAEVAVLIGAMSEKQVVDHLRSIGALGERWVADNVDLNN